MSLFFRSRQNIDKNDKENGKKKNGKTSILHTAFCVCTEKISFLRWQLWKCFYSTTLGHSLSKNVPTGQDFVWWYMQTFPKHFQTFSKRFPNILQNICTPSPKMLSKSFTVYANIFMVSTWQIKKPGLSNHIFFCIFIIFMHVSYFLWEKLLHFTFLCYPGSFVSWDFCFLWEHYKSCVPLSLPILWTHSPLAMHHTTIGTLPEQISKFPEKNFW